MIAVLPEPQSQLGRRLGSLRWGVAKRGACGNRMAELYGKRDMGYTISVGGNR